MNLPSILLTALLWAAGGAALGWLVTMPLHRRSLFGLLASVVLTGTVASVAAVVGNVRAMFISTNELAAVTSISVMAGLAAAISAVVVGRRLNRDNHALYDAVSDIALGHVPSPDRPRLETQLAQVHDQLAESARRLADSRERERALEQSRRELVAWMSHDLRTPLAILRAISEALEDGVVETPETYYKQIHQQVQRLSGMVEDLFELSRIQAGAFAATRERLPLDDLLSDCLAALWPLALASEVELRGDSGEAVFVTANGLELNRALTNLVANAIKHTRPGGSIVACVRADDGAAEVRVRDQCGGIPDDAIGRVFDIGYRVAETRTVPSEQSSAGPAPRPEDGTSGAGLGLAIARGIVEAHAGTLTVRNIAGGCEFCLRVPMDQPGRAEVRP